MRERSNGGLLLLTSRRAAVSPAGQRRGTLRRIAGMLAPSNGGRVLLTGRRPAGSPAGLRRGRLSRIASMRATVGGCCSLAGGPQGAPLGCEEVF
jgi:hypothetical protein